MADLEDVLTIDAAGRVVIPSMVRRRLHLRAGTRLKAEVDGERLILEPVPDREAIAEERGVLVATGSLGETWLDHREIRDARTRKLTGR